MVVPSASGGRYEESRRPPGVWSTQIGFTLNGAALAELQGSDGELGFRGDAGVRDPLFFDFCRDFHARIERGEIVADGEVRDALYAYVRRHTERVRVTPLLA